MRALLRNRNVRTIFVVVAATAAFKMVSALMGLGEWADVTPAATMAYRVFAILLFGALGVYALLWPSPEKDMRLLFHRLSGALFLVIATIHAMILPGDPLNPVSE